MDSFSISVSTAVPGPPAEVHALLDDLAAHPRWTDHFLVDWELTGDPHGVGAKARFRAKGGGPNARGEIEVISSTPTRIVEEGRGGKDGSRRTRGTYELAATTPRRSSGCGSCSPIAWQRWRDRCSPAPMEDWARDRDGSLGRRSEARRSSRCAGRG